jgi:hypothetical protein
MAAGRARDYSGVRVGRRREEGDVDREEEGERDEEPADLGTQVCGRTSVHITYSNIQFEYSIKSSGVVTPPLA